MFAAVHYDLKVIAADTGNDYLHDKTNILFLEMNMENYQARF